MYKANALTDAIGLVIAVSFALQIAIGPGLANLVDLLTSRMSYRMARLVAICGSGLFGGTLGAIAWQSDGNRGWIAIGVLAGLLVASDQRFRCRAMQQAGSISHKAAQCGCAPCCRQNSAQLRRFEVAGSDERP